MNIKRKIAVVGAGLAGSCVTLQLLRKGVKVTLFDSLENYCSTVAVGMINPLVFRRMTKSWRVDDFMPYLISFYRELEETTGKSFFIPLTIRRLFSSEQEKEYWLKKQEREDFRPYMHEVNDEDWNYNFVKNTFGSGRVKQSFFVEVPIFFEAIKQEIVKEGGEIEKRLFLESEVNDYDDVIFCQGFQNKDNSFFKSLPINTTKGQILTIESETIPENESVNRKCFVLPKGKGIFKVGSTYEWHDFSTNITEEAKKQILEKLSFLTDENVKVIGQKAGVRPTVIDRRPCIGTHPDHKNIHIFNGLGTKGYMMAPLLAKEFVSYLIDDVLLDKEINISRFLQK